MLHPKHPLRQSSHPTLIPPATSHLCSMLSPFQMSLLQKEMDGMTAGLTSDKFLIQTMLCDANFDPKAAKDEFKKPENKVQDLKLKVRLTYPSGSSAPKSGQSGKSAGGLASMMKVLMSLFMTLLVAVAVLVALHRTQPKLVKPVVQPLMKHVVIPYVLPALKMIEAHAKKAGILTKTGKLAKKW